MNNNVAFIKEISSYFPEVIKDKHQCILICTSFKQFISFKKLV